MNNTPRSNRVHIGIYGRTNAGKSSFLNNLLGSEVSIVSNIKGTTTDPIHKNFEIDGFGPVTFVDTAGFLDGTILSEKRYEKTINTLSNVDLAIYILDITDMDYDDYFKFKNLALEKKIGLITLVSKVDLLSQNELVLKKEEVEAKIGEAIYISNDDFLGDEIINKIKSSVKLEEGSILGGLLKARSDILMVVSIDDEYPDGRIIFPQSQMIRDALKNDHFITVVEDTNLEAYLKKNNNIDLIIVDSKIFKKVESLVDEEVLLTSFSILFANYKGDLKEYLDGIKFIEENSEEDVNILVYESCKHTSNHEDIGTKKIPQILNKLFKGQVNIDFSHGGSMDEFVNYNLIVHCGACMENNRNMKNKLDLVKKQGISIVNYGILLAYSADMLDRSIKLFEY